MVCTPLPAWLQHGGVLPLRPICVAVQLGIFGIYCIGAATAWLVPNEGFRPWLVISNACKKSQLKIHSSFRAISAEPLLDQPRYEWPDGMAKMHEHFSPCTDPDIQMYQWWADDYSRRRIMQKLDRVWFWLSGFILFLFAVGAAPVIEYGYWSKPCEGPCLTSVYSESLLLVQFVFVFAGMMNQSFASAIEELGPLSQVKEPPSLESLRLAYQNMLFGSTIVGFVYFGCFFVFEQDYATGAWFNVQVKAVCCVVAAVISSFMRAHVVTAAQFVVDLMGVQHLFKDLDELVAGEAKEDVAVSGKALMQVEGIEEALKQVEARWTVLFRNSILMNFLCALVATAATCSSRASPLMVINTILTLVALFPVIQIIRKYNDFVHGYAMTSCVPAVVTWIGQGRLYFKINFFVKTVVVDTTFFIGIASSLAFTALSQIGKLLQDQKAESPGFNATFVWP